MKSIKKQGFTLIELLVVIAIIAILAAILFPVFAQAKAAAKNTVALSNVKQLATAQQIYMGDSDDIVAPRYTQTSAPENRERNWKQIIAPYVKNRDMYRDPINPAAKYLDTQSTPAYMILYGRAVPPENEQFSRGYAQTNLFYLTGKFDDFGFSPTAQEQPANLLAIVEHKWSFPDAGPYLNWEQNPTEPDGTNKGLGWSWGSDKWENKAMSVAFYDSHAKRTTHSAICGKANEVNMWGYQRDRLSTPGYPIPGATIPWIDTYCMNIPQKFR